MLLFGACFMSTAAAFVANAELRIVVRDVASAMQWASHGMYRIAGRGSQLEHANVQYVVSVFNNKTLTLSTSFSGVMTPELAGRIWSEAVNDVIATDAAASGTSVSSSFRIEPGIAVERNRACIEAPAMTFGLHLGQHNIVGCVA